jgi:hypothetical protein
MSERADSSFIARSTAGIILASSIFAFTQTSTTAGLKSGYGPVDGLKRGVPRRMAESYRFATQRETQEQGGTSRC